MKERTKDIFIDAAFIIAVLALALLARLALLPIESPDYQYYLSVWMDRIREAGSWKSLGLRIGDYTPAYMYIMCLVSGLGEALYPLKAVSIVFDYAAAGVMFLLVCGLTGSRRKGIAAMAATLFCPTVIINGAWWCQCDIIYVTFLLLTLLFIFRDKGALAFLMFGIAFSFKLQAVFLMPFLVLMWVKRSTVRLWHFTIVPAVFFVTLVPAWIAGRPLGDMLDIYFLQTSEYPSGTLNFPNFYEFLNENHLQWHHVKEVGSFGVFFAFGVLGLFAYWFCCRKFRMTPGIMLSSAIFSVSLALFTLPHMHERYGLVVDILVIVYALLQPRRIPVALGYMVVSLLSYMPFLIGVNVVPGVYLAVALLALNVYVGMDIARQVADASAVTDRPRSRR